MSDFLYFALITPAYMSHLREDRNSLRLAWSARALAGPDHAQAAPLFHPSHERPSTSRILLPALSVESRHYVAGRQPIVASSDGELQRLAGGRRTDRDRSLALGELAHHAHERTFGADFDERVVARLHERSDARRPPHRRSELHLHDVGDPVASLVWAPGQVRHHGNAGRSPFDAVESGPEAFGGGDHQRCVEGRAHVERQHALRAGGL